MVYVLGNYDQSHNYLQWGGSLPGGDQWSCGLRMEDKGSGNEDDDVTNLVSMQIAVSAFHSDPSSQISPRCKLSFVKYNRIGTDGRYVRNTTNERVLADTPGDGTDGLTHPNQVACVVSLTTLVSRGIAHAGRFYVPLPTMAIGTDGLVAEAAATALKGTVTTFIAALNAVNPQWGVSIFSRAAPFGNHRTVTGSRVGRVLDTQRRRRNHLPELYV